MLFERLLFDPPLRLQRKRQMLPGEDCPDCIHCGHGLHEARPTLRDVLNGVVIFAAGPFASGEVDVDCPTCGKPNAVQWEVHSTGIDARTLLRWTPADAAYAQRTASDTEGN